MQPGTYYGLRDKATGNITAISDGNCLLEGVGYDGPLLAKDKEIIITDYFDYAWASDFNLEEELPNHEWVKVTITVEPEEPQR